MCVCEDLSDLPLRWFNHFLVSDRRGFSAAFINKRLSSPSPAAPPTLCVSGFFPKEEFKVQKV